jgi:hypothetical protein
VNAARAKVHDGGHDGLAALHLDADLLSAPRVGRLTSHNIVGRRAPKATGKGNDRVAVFEHGATGASGTLGDVVDCNLDVLVFHTTTRAGGSGGWGRGCGCGSSGCLSVSRRRNVGRGGGSWLRCGCGWLRFLNGLRLLDYRSGCGSRRGCGCGCRNRRRRGGSGWLWGNRRNSGLLLSRRLRGGSNLGRNAGGGLGLLVEVSSRSGGSLSDGLVVPDGGVDDHGLGDDFGLVDERAPVERSSSGEGAEEQGSKDGRGLHFGVCLLGVCLLGSDVKMLASKGVMLEIAGR